ncbi:hypothetical protein HMPREF3213_00559 [Heyndrickxia coagulans]|uniref:Uncharacterized protein n=1 Tax=Heyndrickxia coagulans TaxID=1398 RepID=A0A133L033_HEYCO|nr:hypothetical protein HMPREF3213_00559 [Heyndrickxia coagulans]
MPDDFIVRQLYNKNVNVYYKNIIKSSVFLKCKRKFILSEKGRK